jgi:bile acid:Na+ symporter, BASS family
MEALKQLLPIVLTISLAGLIVSLGLDATRDDLLYVFRHPRKLLAAFVAVDVIPPAAAFAVAALLPLDPPVKLAIVLMGVTPVPPFITGKELRLGARKEYAYGLYVAMSLLTIIAVPIAFGIGAWLFGRVERISVGTIAAPILKGVLIPLAAGILVRRWWPAFARKAVPWVNKLSILLLVVVLVPVLVVVAPTFATLVGNGTLLAMAIVVTIALVGGHLLGGPLRMDRATLAVASSTRHPGLAILLAQTLFAGHAKTVSAAVLMFVLVSLFVGVVYKRWLTRSAPARSESAPGGPPSSRPFGSHA